KTTRCCSRGGTRVFRSTVSTVSHQCLHHPCSSWTHIPLLNLPSPSPLSGFSNLSHPIGSAMAQQRPGDASHLVGERHRDDLERPPRQKLGEPGIFLGVLPGAPQHGTRPHDENAPQVAVALLGDRPELLFAPS